METSAIPKEVRAMSQQMRAAHDDAVQNIVLLKEQQWRMVNYVLILYGSIFWFKHQLNQTIRFYFAFQLLVLLIFAGSLALIFLTQHSLRKFRNRLHFIYQYYFTANELKRLDISGKPKSLLHDRLNITAFTAVLAVGAMLTSLAITTPSENLQDGTSCSSTRRNLGPIQKPISQMNKSATIYTKSQDERSPRRTL
jgi:hypothetical protein